MACKGYARKIIAHWGIIVVLDYIGSAILVVAIIGLVSTRNLLERIRQCRGRSSPRHGSLPPTCWPKRLLRGFGSLSS